MAKYLSKENLLSILSTFKTKMEAKITAAMPTKLSQLTNDSGYLNDTEVQAKADAALTAAKEYTTSAIGDITQFTLEKVDALPEVTAAKANVIYLVPIEGAESATNNVYDEYLLINGAWEHLGTTEVDLSGYDTSVQVDQKISAAAPQTMTEEDITAFNNELWAEPEVTPAE